MANDLFNHFSQILHSLRPMAFLSFWGVSGQLPTSLPVLFLSLGSLFQPSAHDCMDLSKCCFSAQTSAKARLRSTASKAAMLVYHMLQDTDHRSMHTMSSQMSPGSHWPSSGLWPVSLTCRPHSWLLFPKFDSPLNSSHTSNELGHWSL